jgi:DNA-3-methyladenine glycosylase I
LSSLSPLARRSGSRCGLFRVSIICGRPAAGGWRRQWLSADVSCAPMSDVVLDGIAIGEDGVARCHWADSAPEYRAYHDDEWGFPVADDVRLFEKLSLEGFQAGLSWLTILRKREAFRAAFDGFQFERVAAFGEADVQRLVQDAGIVRHRGKIEAVINNAGRAVELIEAEGSLAAYVWGFAPESGRRPSTRSCSRWAWSTTTCSAATPTSARLGHERASPPRSDQQPLGRRVGLSAVVALEHLRERRVAGRGETEQRHR